MIVLAYFDLIFNSIILVTFSLVNVLPVFTSKFRTFHLVSIHSVLSLCGSLFSLLACYILACFFVSFVVSSLFRFLLPLSEPYTASNHILCCDNDNDNNDDNNNSNDDDDNAL